MLTTILVTDDMPQMRDAEETLNLVIQAIGMPDTLFVADSAERFVEVCCFERNGTQFALSQKIGEIHPPLQGECVFVQSRNNNLIGDVFLRRWFNEAKPQAGHRFRLVNLSCSTEDSRIDVKTVSEKFSVR